MEILMAFDFQRGITEDYRSVVKALRGVGKSFSDKELKRAARKAGEPVREQAEKLTPELKKGKQHYRYKKLSPGQKRSKKYFGNIIAVYLKGNLKKSIKILSFRKDRKGVYIGPKFAGRGKGSGVFGKDEEKVDGYYAHMVFGSARAFQARVTALALRVKSRASVDVFQQELEKRFIRRIKKKYKL
jgi:hypothetical protein